MNPKKSFLVDVWFFSKAILRNRLARRRFLAQLLIVVLSLLVLGNWPLRGWVDASKLRFIVWWGGTGFLTLWMLLLACYDALRVRQELLGKDDS